MAAHRPSHSPSSKRVAGRPPSPWAGIAVSLAFWSTLFVAAGLFAGVALAPKVVTWRLLQNQIDHQQRKLLDLEYQVEQLARVVTALDRDPVFAAEFARVEFDALRPGEEVLAMEASLSLNPLQKKSVAISPEVPAPHPWMDRLTPLATNGSLRWQLLALSAGLVLFAFTFLQDIDDGLTTASQKSGPSFWQQLTLRYRKAE